MEEKKLKEQKSMIELVKAYFDNQKFKYEFDEEKMSLFISVCSNDLDIPTLFIVNKSYNSLVSFSTVPFDIKKEKLVDLLFAITSVNASIPAGAFTIDFKKNKIVYKNDLLFEDSLVSEKTISSFINLTFNIIDFYNDRFLALNNDVVTLEDFIKKI